MHSRTGLGDEPLAAHAAGKQDLSKRVVDLVRTSMVEVLALEVDLRSAAVFGESFGEIERRFSPDVVFQQIRKFRLKSRILLGQEVLPFQFLERGHQRFRNVLSAVDSVVSIHF